jgi:very-short-patch-repair endonuclease
MRSSMIHYKVNLTASAKPGIFKNANDLRKSMTEAEEILWKRIRNRQLGGIKFRRQHPLDIFIADLYSHEKKLIIELDGNIHDITEQKEYDEGRTTVLENKGYKVLRFKNEEVFDNLENVLERILKC